MAIDIPMNTLKKVIYNNGEGVELNAFNVADCKWRKPCNITIPEIIPGIEKITVTRLASESNCGQLDVTSITASGTVLYGDTLSVQATAETGYKNPTASFTGGVSNNKVISDVAVTASATALTKITLMKNTHVKTISFTYIDGYTETSKTVTAAGTYYAKNGSDYSWSATADDYCYMTSGNSGSGTLSGNITISLYADYGYYTVSLSAITNATAYVNTSASNYASSVTAKYGSTIYVQVKPNNCYIYTLNNTNYTPSSPYTTSYVLNSTNFNLSSTTPAASPTASNKPTATKSIGGSVSAAYYKVTLTVTNGTVTRGATTTIQYGSAISYRAKGNSKYYYVNKTTGGYGDTGYTTTYTPTSSVLPADGGATSATAVAFTYNVGSCTAYKTYTIKTTRKSCEGYTFVKSTHALGEGSYTSKSDSGHTYTVYETDSFHSYAYASNAMGNYKLTAHSCTNNGVTVLPSRYQYLTVSGSGSNTSWTTTTSSTASTGIKHRVDFGVSDAPETVTGNIVISYTAAKLTYTYYPYKSNIYSSRINSGTTTFFVYAESNMSTVPPRLAYYPASAIRINGCICLHEDGNNSEFANLPLTTTKEVTLKHAGITGKASMGNRGPSSGNSGASQCQYLSVSKKAGLYEFYVRIWGISIPS